MPLATIDLATKKNPDWWGMSYKDQGGLHIRRGQSPRSARKAWRRAPLDTERIFHARIGTSGTKDIRNTHPFECGERDASRRLLFHNGTVSMPSVRSEFCDTWHLAQVLKLGSNDDIKGALVSYATMERSRFVVQNEDPAVETLLYGHWTKRDGAHYSNDYLFPAKPLIGYGYNTGETYRGPSVSVYQNDVWVDGKWVPGRSTQLAIADVASGAAAELSDEEDDELWIKRMEERDADLNESFPVRRRHDRIAREIDLCYEASQFHPDDEQAEVFDRAYARFHAMTDEEFARAETKIDLTEFTEIETG